MSAGSAELKYAAAQVFDVCEGKAAITRRADAAYQTRGSVFECRWGHWEAMIAMAVEMSGQGYSWIEA